MAHRDPPILHLPRRHRYAPSLPPPSISVHNPHPHPAALGILTLYFSGKPNADFFSGTAINVALAYAVVTFATNVSCSLLICGRIYYAGRRYTVAMGAEVGRAYTSAAAIIVESMLLSTVTGIAYLVSFARNSQLEIFFLSIYVMMTVSHLQPHPSRFSVSSVV